MDNGYLNYEYYQKCIMLCRKVKIFLPFTVKKIFFDKSRQVCSPSVLQVHLQLLESFLCAWKIVQVITRTWFFLILRVKLYIMGVLLNLGQILGQSCPLGLLCSTVQTSDTVCPTLTVMFVIRRGYLNSAHFSKNKKGKGSA